MSKPNAVQVEPKSEFKFSDPSKYIADEIEAKYARWDKLQERLPEALRGKETSRKSEG